MMLRSTKVKLILFVVITLLGVSYVGAEYVGLSKYVTGNSGCKICADFPDSGGIFSNAEVTYRGVTVGQVGALKLIKGGVRVELDLNSCDSPKIPASTAADRRQPVGGRRAVRRPRAAERQRAPSSGPARTSRCRATTSRPPPRNC